MPAPPSFVALPPMPIIMFVAPLSSACRINSPVPREVVTSGSRFSRSYQLQPTGRRHFNKRGFAIAGDPPTGIHFLAQRPCNPGVTFGTLGGCDRVFASTVPSPPSATGTETYCASGKISRNPFSIACATSLADKLSYKSLGRLRFSYLCLLPHDAESVSYSAWIPGPDCNTPSGHDVINE